MSFNNEWFMRCFGGMEYPYTDSNRYNDDWILMIIKELINEINNFVNLNTIKYADPIQWDISRQYEKNTIVIDPITGTAYISTKPVPRGVRLTNTDYWTVVFTLDIISANHNITLRDDGANIISTFDSEIGDWLMSNGVLYKVIRNIDTGSEYVIGYNIQRYTVEQFLHDAVDSLNSLIVALSEDVTSLDNSVGDLENLKTSVKTSIVNAINNLYDTSYVYINVKDFGAVGDGITDDTSAIQNAINSADTKSIIFFPNGTYACGSITLKSNIKLLGDKESCLKLNTNLDSSSYWIYAPNNTNISIESLKFDGDFRQYARNRFVVDDFTIENCELCNFTRYNPIQCFGDNLKIANNFVHDTENCDCIAVSSGKNAIISDNHVLNFADTGIVVAANYVNAIVTNNIIECTDNEQALLNAQGIAIADAHYCEITDNIIFMNNRTQTGIRVYRDPNTEGDCTDINISNNSIYNANQYGIVVSRLTRGSLNNNIIRSCNRGIDISANASVVYDANHLIAITDIAFLFDSVASSDVSIVNSVVESADKYLVITVNITRFVFSDNRAKLVTNSYAISSSATVTIAAVANNESVGAFPFTTPSLGTGNSVSVANYTGMRMLVYTNISSLNSIQILTTGAAVKTRTTVNGMFVLEKSDIIQISRTASDSDTWIWQPLS